MLLKSRIIGNKEAGKVIIILHGLYGSSESWLQVARILGKDFLLHLPDQRNHGSSFHSQYHNYDVMAEDLEKYLDYHKINNTILVGHSMGGKTAIQFAIKFPHRIDKLIVADIAPGAYKYLDEPSSHVNFHLNLLTLMSNINPENYCTYREVENVLKAEDSQIKNLILKNIKKQNGKLVWKLNFKSIMENINNILGGYSPDDFIENKIETETVFLKAQNSDYISNNDEKFIRFAFRNVKIHTIVNSSHWLHYEQPEQVAAAISYFVDQ